MKKILILSLLILISCSEKKEIIKEAEVSCGQCMFGIENPKGCDLAIRIADKTFFIDGVGIDDFGDAHDINTGFCNVIRKATVEGNVENGRFKASSIKLIK